MASITEATGGWSQGEASKRGRSMIMEHGIKQLGLSIVLVACGARQASSSDSAPAGVVAEPPGSNVQTSGEGEPTAGAQPYENCHDAAIARSAPEATAGIQVCNAGLGAVWPDFIVERLADSCGGAGHGVTVPTRCTNDAECSDEATCEIEQGFCELPLACDSAADCGDGEACFCANGSLQTGTSGENWANVCKPAECESSEDCGGLACAVSIDPCHQYTGAYCHTTEDECDANRDCADDRYACMFDARVHHWSCQSLATCQ